MPVDPEVAKSLKIYPCEHCRFLLETLIPSLIEDELYQSALDHIRSVYIIASGCVDTYSGNAVRAAWREVETEAIDTALSLEKLVTAC